MRFLVVDDSTTMRRIIINTLNKLGHQECLEACQRARGHRAARTGHRRHDHHRLEHAGDVRHRLHPCRADDGRARGDVPVLMVTTNAAKDDIVEALRAGVNNYVVKPFTPDTIKEKIDAVLAK